MCVNKAGCERAEKEKVKDAVNSRAYTFVRGEQADFVKVGFKGTILGINSNSVVIENDVSMPRVIGSRKNGFKESVFRAAGIVLAPQIVKFSVNGAFDLLAVQRKN